MGFPDLSGSRIRQVTTLDRAKLVEQIGELPAAARRRVNDGLQAALALL